MANTDILTAPTQSHTALLPHGTLTVLVILVALAECYSDFLCITVHMTSQAVTIADGIPLPLSSLPIIREDLTPEILTLGLAKTSLSF
jgi:hypothetical protein